MFLSSREKTIHTTHDSTLIWKYNDDSESTLATHFIKYNDYESTRTTHVFKNNDYESTLATHFKNCATHEPTTKSRSRSTCTKLSCSMEVFIFRLSGIFLGMLKCDSFSPSIWPLLLLGLSGTRPPCVYLLNCI